jgi:D-alanyl-D-alanine carboxypeptidase/D-alanyl-D-alanine-endopeptidase (penicillin-binding protein 4)
VHKNCIKIEAYPTSPGNLCKIVLKPSTKSVKVINRVKTVSRGRKDYITVSRHKDKIVVSGRIRINGKPQGARVAILNPDIYFANLLKERLEKGGIKIAGTVLIKNEILPKDNLQKIAEIKTDIKKVLKGCNKKSINLYAECLFKLLGYKLYKKGTFKNGSSAVKKLLGIDFKLADGSGLSRKNMATPKQVVKLLEKIYKHGYGKFFIETLPTGGESNSTLRRRMQNLKNRVFAKTGHLRDVSTLSGYIKAKSGDTLIFSILINDKKRYSANRLQDRICQVISGY